MSVPEEWLPALKKSAVQQFILDNESRDVFDLSLAQREVDGVSMKIIAPQVKARQKAKIKLPEWYNSPGIIFPPPQNLEQASSELTARYKTSIFSGRSLTDLSGGTGVDCAYLSEGFDEAVYVEPDTGLCELAQHNFSILGKRIRVVNSTAEEFLREKNTFTHYFIDPSRRDEHQSRLFAIQDCKPDVSTLLPEFSPDAKLLVKLSPMLDITRATAELQHRVEEIHIVAVDNEVKELLLLVGKETHNPEVTTINLRRSSRTQTFAFRAEDEAKATVDFSGCGKYIYEANPAVRKSGANNLVAARFGLKKLGLHTHLYTSDEYVPSFPGRVIQVLHTGPYQPNRFRKNTGISKANVQTRNFPEEVSQIRKRTKLKDGGSYYVFFYTDFEGKLMFAGGEKAS